MTAYSVLAQVLALLILELALDNSGMKHKGGKRK